MAMMEEEVVRKRGWMTREYFLDMVGAVNLIPGPNSTEMTMHCGRMRAGIPGLIVAGLCFIGPAAVLTALFAWMYETYGSLPELEPFLYGITPAVIAVVLHALLLLGRTALKSVELIVIALLTFAACLFGVNEIFALFAAGGTGILISFLTRRNGTVKSVLPWSVIPLISSVIAQSHSSIFLIFLKIGAILYGSGYVLFAFFESELVSTGLLSRQVVIDAIAVGQMTPGPLFSAATFVGWQLGGPAGAAAATAGIFLPSFLFVVVLHPLIPMLRRSAAMSSFLDSINAASVAVILSVVAAMGAQSAGDVRSILIAAGSFAAVYYFRSLNSAVVVVGGSAAGFFLRMVPL